MRRYFGTPQIADLTGELADHSDWNGRKLLPEWANIDAPAPIRVARSFDRDFISSNPPIALKSASIIFQIWNALCFVFNHQNNIEAG